MVIKNMKKYIRNYGWLTPSFYFDSHLKEELSVAKFGLNSTWARLFRIPEIPLQSKYTVFYATSRAVLCYAAQVWGFIKYECVERLKDFL